MKKITYADAVKMHTDKFGVEPVITGINFRNSDEIFDNILLAIENNEPYVEDDLKEGVVT